MEPVNFPRLQLAVEKGMLSAPYRYKLLTQTDNYRCLASSVCFLRTVFDDAASLPTGFIMAQSFLDFRQHQVQHGVSYLMLVGVWYPTPTTLPQSKTRLFPSSIK